ncbi:MAG: cyclodeaminase/cyclohydrolase family protein [Oscillospiraceae bacterium]|nr:cyclodeaminase/cyclohydrolase family protein [Oscillospiraceae bacterium]
MDFSKYRINEFLSQLSSKEAVPGGGGASALVGALGAALGCMVGNLTVGKAKYKDVETDMYLLMNEAEQLQSQLTALIQKDADGFAPLAKAYSMDKNDPEYDTVMEQCLRKAAETPLEIVRLSCRMIELHQQFADKGSTLAVSDAGTGVVFCWAAMYGGALNVMVNTRLMKDRVYAERMNNEVEDLMNKYWKLADETYESVFRKLKN